MATVTEGPLVSAANASIAAFPTFITNDPGGAQPNGSIGPIGMTPAQISQAYGINSIAIDGGAIRGDGTGQTIAIVDAYDDPNIATDLRNFDVTFGLSDPPSFKRVAQDGTTNYPGVDTLDPAGDTWEVEESLDVEWAHAVAPGANILLVEASGADTDDLLAAVRYAASVSGVSVVSMSWTEGEDPSETALDSTFVTPNGHAGVTFVASTGDTGEPGGYPAYSPNVVAVGGTTLYTDSAGDYEIETGWSLSGGQGGGGGISQYEPQPAYQSGVVTQSSTQRTTPDVSFDANPNTGVAIDDSYDFGAAAPWIQVGGTSLSAPSWAGLIAIANQSRSYAGLGSLDGPSQTLPRLYSLPAADFHDITSGNNGFAAGPGYDLVTGRGTPIANLLVPALAHSTGLSVVGSTPAINTVESTAPTDFTLYLSDAYDASSVTADAFTVNGIAASSYTLTSSTSITFHFAGSPVANPGLQSMVLAAGTITRTSDSSPVAAFQANFRYDPNPISVTSFSPAAGSLVTAPFTTLTVQFSEAYAAASISAGNLSLSAGTVIGYSLLNSTTVAYYLGGLTQEGTLVASIAGGAVTDAFGDPGAAASGTFTLDVATAAFPTPLAAVGLPAAQVSQGSLSGAIDFAGDTDSYTLSLAAGQTLSIALLPAPRLTGQISLSGPGVDSSASSAAEGSPAVLESVAIGASGTYTITASGAANGTGAYTLEAVLNGAIEGESVAASGDDSQAAAQSVAAGFRSLGGAAGQAAVVGTLSSASDQDWYSFTLSAGESAALDADSLGGAPGLELRDPAGSLIVAGATLGTVSAVSDFVATTAGTYYARVFGTASQSYSLIITKNADFDLGQSSTLATALPIDSALQGGQLQVSGQLGSALLEGFESNSLAAYTATVPASDDATLEGDSAHDGHLGLSTGADTEWIYRDDAAAQTLQGETLSVWVRFDGSTTGRAYFGFGASALGTLSLVVGGNTNQLLIQDNSGYSTFTTLASADQTYQANTFYRLQVTWGAGGAIVGQLYASDGVTLLNTITANDTAFSSGGIAFRGFGNNFDFDSVTVSADQSNVYRVQMAAGGTLGASTTTPGDSGGSPGNTLDPQVQIFNAAGMLIASNDNSGPDGRNALLNYNVPAGGGGTYYVAVSASPLTTAATSGAYVLTLTGTLLNHAPVLNTSVTMTLPTFAEDPTANTGSLVSSMLATGAGGSPISDSDSGANQGIAVTGVDDSNGTWQYSVDNGNTWAAFNSPSPGNVLLLAADNLTRIRFVPNQNYNGNPASSIRFRAWDQTSGFSGGLADASLGGDRTAFSSAVGTAAITISEVNDSPVLLTGALANLQVVVGSGPASLSLGPVTYGPGGGADEQSQTLTYTVTTVPNPVGGSILISGNPTPLAAGQVISLAQLQSLEFVEAAGDPGLQDTFGFDVTDNGTTDGQPDPKTISQKLTISIVVRPEEQMLADIDPGSGSSTPTDFTLVNQTVFFAADDGTHGVELWQTDGTNGGTALVKDIVSGAAGSWPRWLTDYNGKVYYEAYDPVDGYELNVSDGTAAGTQLVKDIAPGFYDGAPSDLIVFNGELIFQAQTPSTGIQLWESDGTAAGTVMLKDLDPVDGFGSPQNFTIVNNTLFFEANDGTHGNELWKTDGTTAGTVMVADIDPGPVGSYPSSMVNLNGELFFATGNVVPQIWKSDGTAAGTVPLADAAGITIGDVTDLTVRDGEVYFMAYDGKSGLALWKTDGTTAGTQIVDDLDPTGVFPWPESMVNVNGTLFFAADDGTDGQQLWASDGTTAGTVMLTDVPGGLDAADLTGVDGTLLFSGTDGANGVELWRSDGTAAGTQMIADINPGSGSSNPASFVNVNGTLYFSADDGTHGTELWTYSHLPPSTAGLPNLQVAENAAPSEVSLFPAFSDPVDMSAGMSYAVVGDTNASLFASTSIDPVSGLLTLTYRPGVIGTANITVEATDSAGGSVATTFAILVGSNNQAPVLDGSVGLSLPTIGEDPSTNSGSSIPALLATGAAGNPISDSDPGALQGVAVVAADDSNGTWQFSVDSGASWAPIAAVTITNSLLLADSADDLLRFVPDADYNGAPTLTLRAWDQTSGASGAYADTTITGGFTAFSTATVTATQPIYEVNDPPELLGGVVANLQFIRGSAPTPLGLGNVTYGPGGGIDEQSQTLTYTVTALPAAASGSIFIAGDSTPLMVGQVITLTQLQDLEFSEAADDLGVLGTFSFSVTDNGTTRGQSDPQTLGQSLTITIIQQPETELLADINPGSGSSSPQGFTLAGQTVFFAADDGTDGAELWATSGTAAGTVLVADIAAGSTSSSPRWLTALNGQVYFEAYDPGYGYELLVSDGTAAGTELVDDIAPGGASGGPSYIVNFNGELIFQAQTPSTVSQLWESDGTAAGTVMLKQINTTGGSNPTNFTIVGNTLYFSASDGADGTELWKTDGTTAGTVMVADINPSSGGSFPSEMVSLNGTLYFATGNTSSQFWKSDGTAAGTVPVTDAAGITLGHPSSLAVVDNELYFVGSDGSRGQALWKTDGTTAGTQIVDDVDPTNAFPQPTNLVNVNGTLFFTSSDGTQGQQLWKSDGTAAGTVMLTHVAGGLGASNLTNVGGLLLFSGTDGVNGTELWRSDGTAAGTKMIFDIDPGSGSSSPGNFVAVNGTLYFSANDGTHGTELWAYSHPAPTTSGLPNVDVAENAAPSAVSLFSAFSDLVDSSNAMTYTVVGDTNPGLFSSLPIDPATGTLSLNYKANTLGRSSITVEATDTIGQTVEATFTVQVDANHAPLLDTSVVPHFSAIEENNAASAGELVSSLLATGAGGQPISDADPGALQGIAIVAADNTNGTWQFSLNAGGSWSDLASPSTSSALLLASDSNTLIRFVPADTYSGTISSGITFRAWDQTSGANGATADTTTNGGSSAFSTAVLNASLLVNPLPQVVGVYVSGSAWRPSFLAMLDGAGLGDGSVAGLGFEMPDGASQLTTMLPWTNLNTLSVAFDESVSVAQDSLTLYDDANNPIASTGFSYSAATDVATWTFPQLSIDKYWIGLSSAAVSDALGTPLDGEWTTSVSTFSAGSGDGAPGGDFDFRFNVVPGDSRNTGNTANGDVLEAKLAVGGTTNSTNYRLDVDGSDNITNGDVLLTKLAIGGNINSIRDPTLPAVAAPAAAAPEDSQLVATPSVFIAAPAANAASLAPITPGAITAAATAAPTLGGASSEALDVAVAALPQSAATGVLPLAATALPAAPLEVYGPLEVNSLPASLASGPGSPPSPSNSPTLLVLPDALATASSAALAAPAGDFLLPEANTESAEPSAAARQMAAVSMDWFVAPQSALANGASTTPASAIALPRLPSSTARMHRAIDAALADDEANAAGAAAGRRWRAHLAVRHSPTFG